MKIRGLFTIILLTAILSGLLTGCKKPDTPAPRAADVVFQSKTGPFLSVAVGAEAEVYAAAWEGGLACYKSDGDLIEKYPITETFHGLCYSEGLLYCYDESTLSVFEFDPQSKELRTLCNGLPFATASNMAVSGGYVMLIGIPYLGEDFMPELRDFGLLNTPAALVLPLAFSPFAVFLFRQFIKSVPQEILDYTVLETSSAFNILRYAVFPYVKPAAAALAVLLFCESWNMVEPVLIFAAKNPDIHPLSVALNDLPAPVSFSAASVYMIPILFLFLLFKETLASSMERFRWGK